MSHIRIQSGLPRGGIGYVGVPLGLAALLGAYKLEPPFALWVSGLALPICFWLGVGLRIDGDCGAVTDKVIMESRRRFDAFGLSDNDVSIFRISTAVILLGLASLSLAICRRMGLH